MKIAVRGGHTELCTGASALINELTEDRKVKDAVVKYLRTLGQDVLDVLHQLIILVVLVKT